MRNIVREILLNTDFAGHWKTQHSHLDSHEGYKNICRTVNVH